MAERVESLTYKDGGSGPHVDLDRLIGSRLLAQANSGGGKSRLVRQLLEETFGRVQHFVIDPEGEFATLREAFPYVLAAKTGGDVMATPKTAKLLCRRLVELGASAVLDLYELSLPERREFVKVFLTELVNLPRSMWRPIIVVIDEAHMFAPERGSGESQSTDAVIALCTLGRKRGLCAVLATQRISKLHKDAAAELLNKMIGRTGLDVDVKRAADELGFDKEQRQRLPRLEPGEFFVYGPAISPAVTLVKTGAVKTTHPEAGQISAAPPPPPSKVKAMLAQLVDLPKEAEAEARTLADMERQVKQLRGDLSRAQKTGVVDERAIDRARAETARQFATTTTSLRRALEGAMKFIINISAASFDVAGVDKAELERAIAAAVEKATVIVDQRLSARARQIDDLRESAERIASQLKAALGDEEVTIDVGVTKNEPFSVAPKRLTPRAATRAIGAEGGAAGNLTGAKLKIARALAELESIGVNAATRAQLGFYVGMTFSGGYGSNTLGAMKTEGLIDYPESGYVALTDAGRAAGGAIDPPIDLDDLHARVRSHLNGLGERIFDAVVALGKGGSVTRDELGDVTGATYSGGYGSNTLGALHTAGIVRYPTKGSVGPSDLLFPEGLS